MAQMLHWHKSHGITNFGGTNVGGKKVGGKNVGGKNVGGKKVGGKKFTVLFQKYPNIMFLNTKKMLEEDGDRGPQTWFALLNKVNNI
jgi:hypothetical protein